MPEVVTYFRDWTPPLDYTEHLEGILRQLPDSVPPGVGSVVLRNVASLTRKEARRKSVGGSTPDKALGLYYRASKGRPAHIELFLDTILAGWPGWVTRAPILRYYIVSRVLFHELGHHVHAVRSPTAPSSEDEADRIGDELRGRHLRQHYWYLRSVGRILSFPFRWIDRWIVQPRRRRNNP